ncbi:MAG: GatB/YqeY domain-containing protein [Clostridia bacterium]|nr:GatB/YqeY domain-containing protein [Clostridia bacterium]
MLKEKLLEDLKTAMKEKDEIKKNTVQMVRAAILQVEKDKGVTLDDNQVLEIIAKESKKRKDSLDDYKKSGREDLISQVEKEIEILATYLPKQLSKEEITEIVKQIIEQTGATSMKDMGVIMKESKAKMGASAEGKTINEVVKELLG